MCFKYCIRKKNIFRKGRRRSTVLVLQVIIFIGKPFQMCHRVWKKKRKIKIKIYPSHILRPFCLLLSWQKLTCNETDYNTPKRRVIQSWEKPAVNPMTRSFKTQMWRQTHQVSTAPTGSGFLLVSCLCILLYRFRPAWWCGRRLLRRAWWAPPDCEGVAETGGTQTSPGGSGTGPAGAPRRRGAAGGGRS